MWNAACAPYSASAKVINGSGEIEEYVGRHPVRAGEVMVEHPRRFVCDAGQGTSVWGAGFRVWRRTKISKGGPLWPFTSCCRRAAAKSYFGRRSFPALIEFSLPRAEVKQVRNEPRGANERRGNGLKIYDFTESRVNEYCSAPEVMRGRVWRIGGTART